jgi:ankyrin repeat protein
VAILLSKGANPNAMDQDGISPWIEAYIKNREPIKYLFLDHYRIVCPETKSEMCTGNVEMIRDDTNSKDPGTLRMRLS